MCGGSFGTSECNCKTLKGGKNMFKTLQIVSAALVVVIVVLSQPVEPVEAAGIPGSKAVQILQNNFPNGIYGVAYQPTPTDYFTPGTPQKYGFTDFWNSDFEALWNPAGDNKSVVRTVHFPDGSTKNQGDLQTLSDMGVNLLRLYFWQGQEGWVDHQPFLNECDSLGIKLIVPIFITADANFKNTQYYKNIDWIIQSTSNHSSVVFYSIGNEISPQGNPQVFENIGIAAQRVRQLLGENGNQLICSPTFPSQEAMSWFVDAGTEVDVWAFNIYDPIAMQKAVKMVGKDQTVNGHPVFVSEFGVASFDIQTYTQNPQRQVTYVPQLMEIIYDNVDKIWGGIYFEFSDERYKGLQPQPYGGQPDKTQPPSTYVAQIGGTYPTYQGGPTHKVPSSAVGNATFTWKTGNWNGDGVYNSEGYFGMGFLQNTNKTALTVKNGASVSGRLYPWVYRVDDMFLRPIYNNLKDQWTKSQTSSIDVKPGGRTEPDRP